eukprot:CAMPEP_0183302272 /NCGR_PEP_ID=MMETSP0160_2-20130417/8114_1 /TAXON_ID=2839 ORGANISM="Odontella Sinensis, Strain Grunow 1884" /NCGR_SAMPLE_ID=MMETSP0160_2 /ASSEMBLY_ACC=CAM_ASM_000250 /LENGTH=239 /DNA_ID=CAMNT_0025465017 /DNA_START=263 /DNA_END=983 /DNA_ORIENTATION=-
MTKAIVDGSSITKKIPVREPSAFDSISTVVPADILNDRNSTTPTRTIFKRYWDVTEEEKIVLSVAGGAYAPLPSLSSFSSVSSVEEGTESYSDENGMNGRDSILAESGPQSPAHPANEPPPKLVVQRRSIFQPIEEFVPSLGLRHTGRASSSRPQLRKAQSTSVLMTNKGPAFGLSGHIPQEKNPALWLAIDHVCYQCLSAPRWMSLSFKSQGKSMHMMGGPNFSYEFVEPVGPSQHLN